MAHSPEQPHLTLVLPSVAQYSTESTEVMQINVLFNWIVQSISVFRNRFFTYMTNISQCVGNIKPVCIGNMQPVCVGNMSPVCVGNMSPVCVGNM